eukprot:scaffold4846_cov99-Isochrysis_galbana.AAC.4
MKAFPGPVASAAVPAGAAVPGTGGCRAAGMGIAPLLSLSLTDVGLASSKSVSDEDACSGSFVVRIRERVGVGVRALELIVPEQPARAATARGPGLTSGCS